jgi:hypothetical protein
LSPRVELHTLNTINRGYKSLGNWISNPHFNFSVYLVNNLWLIQLLGEYLPHLSPAHLFAGRHSTLPQLRYRADTTGAAIST